METYWDQYGKEHLKDKTIVDVRYLTDEEAESLGWNSRSLVIHLDDGTLIYPSRDDEGNGPGALFGQTPENGLRKELTFPVLSKKGP